MNMRAQSSKTMVLIDYKALCHLLKYHNAHGLENLKFYNINHRQGKVLSTNEMPNNLEKGHFIYHVDGPGQETGPQQ